MGRLGWLNRVAFGRGAFEGPILDEAGDFIVNPNARLVDNLDHYHQQWDERGNPVNPRTHKIDAEFRKAKNEVLVIIGATKKKNDELRSNPPLARWEIEQLLVRAETRTGQRLDFVTSLLLFGTTWPFRALRGAIQTFHSSSNVPVFTLLRNGLNNSGLLAFMTSGQLAWLLSSSAEAALVGPNVVVREHDYCIVKHGEVPWEDRRKPYRIA